MIQMAHLLSPHPILLLNALPDIVNDLEFPAHRGSSITLLSTINPAKIFKAERLT
jgi:hypothetical protein